MKQFLGLICIVASLTSFSQSSNKLSFSKGQKLEMIAKVKAVVTQDVMGQSMDVNINSTINRLFDIEDVKNGTATIEHKIKRVQFNFDAMGQTQAFDSEKEEDMKGEMGKSMEKNIKNKYTLTVSPEGSIVSVKADDDNTNKTAEKGADMMANMMAQFAEGLEVPKAGDLFPLQLKSKGTVAKGQTWTDSVATGETGLITYKVNDVTASDILIDYSSESNSKKKQDVGNGMSMDISIKNMVTGKITLDKKSGLVRERTVETNGSGTMEVMGQTIPMKTKMTGSVVVTGL
jgi:hypothetical protein